MHYKEDGLNLPEVYYGQDIEKVNVDLSNPENWRKARPMGFTSIPEIQNPNWGRNDFLDKEDKFILNAYDRGGYVDLFEDYENIPQKVQVILDRYADDFGGDGSEMDYQDTANMLKEIEALGYTFDYYLDNEPYGLRPIDVPLNQLRGYEEFENGGQVKTINNKLVYRGDDNRLTTIGTIRNVKGEKRVYKSPFAKVFIKENTDELVENWAKENGYKVWKEDFGDSYARGGSLYEVNRVGEKDMPLSESMMGAKNLTELKKRIKEKYGTTEGFRVRKRNKSGAFHRVNFNKGGSTKPNPTQKIKHKDLMNRTDYYAYVKINDYPYTATVRDLNSFKNHLNRKDETFTPNVFGEITYISDNASDEWVYELNKLIYNKKKKMENKMERGGEIKALKQELKKLENINSKEAYEKSNAIRDRIAFLQAQELHESGSTYSNGGAIEPKLNFGDFKETLQEYEIEGGFGKTLEKGLQMYYLPNNSKFLNTKFKHRDKRKAYKEYLELYSSMFENKGGSTYSNGGGVGEQKQMSRTILNDTVHKLIKKNGNDFSKYSQFELSTLDSYVSQRDISDEMAQTIWGLAIQNGFNGYMSKVLVVNSGTGKILNYVGKDFSKVDAVNPSKDENTIATLLNNIEVIDVHSDSLRLLSHYDLGIIINKNNADLSNLKMVCSKLKSNNMLIFVAPTSILYGDNAVKTYINEKFDLIKSFCDESSNSCISVLKKL